jgi:hypothetical protein
LKSNPSILEGFFIYQEGCNSIKNLLSPLLYCITGTSFASVGEWAYCLAYKSQTKNYAFKSSIPQTKNKALSAVGCISCIDGTTGLIYKQFKQ